MFPKEDGLQPIVDFGEYTGGGLRPGSIFFYKKNTTKDQMKDFGEYTGEGCLFFKGWKKSSNFRPYRIQHWWFATRFESSG